MLISHNLTKWISSAKKKKRRGHPASGVIETGVKLSARHETSLHNHYSKLSVQIQAAIFITEVSLNRLSS
jgi:hypothetical protein